MQASDPESRKTFHIIYIGVIFTTLLLNPSTGKNIHKSFSFIKLDTYLCVVLYLYYIYRSLALSKLSCLLANIPLIPYTVLYCFRINTVQNSTCLSTCMQRIY